MTVSEHAQDCLTKLLCHVMINKSYKDNEEAHNTADAPFWERVKQLGTLTLKEEIKLLRQEDRQIQEALKQFLPRAQSRLPQIFEGYECEPFTYRSPIINQITQDLSKMKGCP